MTVHDLAQAEWYSLASLLVTTYALAAWDRAEELKLRVEDMCPDRVFGQWDLTPAAQAMVQRMAKNVIEGQLFYFDGLARQLFHTLCPVECPGCHRANAIHPDKRDAHKHTISVCRGCSRMYWVTCPSRLVTDSEYDTLMRERPDLCDALAAAQKTIRMEM